HDHDDGRPLETQPGADPRSNHRGPEREPLPMLWLWEHPQSGPPCRANEPGSEMRIEFSELEFTEPERYELHEGPFYHFQISRREFVQVVGAGLLLSVAVPSAFAQRAGNDRATSLAQRLHIDADGIISVFTNKVEV